MEAMQVKKVGVMCYAEDAAVKAKKAGCHPDGRRCYSTAGHRPLSDVIGHRPLSGEIGTTGSGHRP